MQFSANILPNNRFLPQTLWLAARPPPPRPSGKSWICHWEQIYCFNAGWHMVKFTKSHVGRGSRNPRRTVSQRATKENTIGTRAVCRKYQLVVKSFIVYRCFPVHSLVKIEHCRSNFVIVVICYVYTSVFKIRIHKVLTVILFFFEMTALPTINVYIRSCLQRSLGYIGQNISKFLSLTSILKKLQEPQFAISIFCLCNCACYSGPICNALRKITFSVFSVLPQDLL